MANLCVKSMLRITSAESDVPSQTVIHASEIPEMTFTNKNTILDDKSLPFDLGNQEMTPGTAPGLC